MAWQDFTLKDFVPVGLSVWTLYEKTHSLRLHANYIRTPGPPVVPFFKYNISIGCTTPKLDVSARAHLEIIYILPAVIFFPKLDQEFQFDIPADTGNALLDAKEVFTTVEFEVTFPASIRIVKQQVLSVGRTRIYPGGT